MDNVFMGLIAAFGFNFTPRGWAPCVGQLMSIVENSALFALLGTTYGGDGVQTFGIPDLRGRTLVGMGNGPGLPMGIVQGEMIGTQQVTLTMGNMPQHVHTLNAVKLKVFAGLGANPTPANGFSANVTNGYADAPNTLSGNALSGTTDIAGGSLPIGIVNPYLGINYCIAVEGIFPSRN